MANDVSTFKVYEAQFNGAFAEVEMQFANAFNEASNGSLQLGNEQHRGDFRDESFFLETASLIEDRDPTNTAASTGKNLQQADIRSVKVDKRMQVDKTEDSFYKTGLPLSTFGRVVGEQAAVAVQVSRVNRIIKSLVAALTEGNTAAPDGFGVGKTVLDVSAGAGTSATNQPTLTHYNINEVFRLFGDRANGLTFGICHSKVWFDLVGDAIVSNSFETQAFAINTGVTATLGRPMLVTDSSDLVITDGHSAGVDEYRTLFLTIGAGRIDQSEELRTMLDRVSGLGNIVMRTQSEWTETIGCKGYSYTGSMDKTTAQDTQLATATNWAAKSSDVKSSAGVMLVTK
jgi:hypothetical protein